MSEGQMTIVVAPAKRVLLGVLDRAKRVQVYAPLFWGHVQVTKVDARAKLREMGDTPVAYFWDGPVLYLEQPPEDDR